MGLFGIFKKAKRIVRLADRLIDTGEYKEYSPEWKFNNAKSLFENTNSDLWISLLKESADSNYAPAQYQLGNMLVKGEEVEKDYALGFQYLSKAAEQNIPEACYDLGHLYQNGFGCEQNYSKSFACYKKAADLGFVDAIHQVGAFYYEGVGVREDKEEAVKWFKKAAFLDFVPSLIILGNIYYNEEKDKESYEMLSRASELGSEEADELLEDEVYDQFR